MILLIPCHSSSTRDHTHPRSVLQNNPLQLNVLLFQVVINNQPLHILAEALAGVNVDNCPHPCVTRPCGDHARCVPHRDAFKCQCERHCQETNAITTSSSASFSGSTFLHYTDPDIVHRCACLLLLLGSPQSYRFRLTSRKRRV